MVVTVGNVGKLSSVVLVTAATVPTTGSLDITVDLSAKKFTAPYVELTQFKHDGGSTFKGWAKTFNSSTGVLTITLYSAGTTTLTFDSITFKVYETHSIVR